MFLSSFCSKTFPVLFQNFEAFLPCWIVTVCNISLRFSQVLNKNVGVLKKVLEHFN